MEPIAELALIFINSLFIIGLYEASEPGRVLADVHDTIERLLPNWLYQPIWGCVYCMASVWGGGLFLVYYFPMYQHSFFFLLWGFLHIVAVSGLTYFLYDMMLFFRRTGE